MMPVPRYSIGHDAIRIDRFTSWTTYSRKQLAKIFSVQELDYAFSIPAKTAERLAVRFAAREAFYKALCGIDTECRLSFLHVVRQVCVATHGNGAPYLSVTWSALEGYWSENVNSAVHSSLSLCHTGDTAYATVILWVAE